MQIFTCILKHWNLGKSGWWFFCSLTTFHYSRLLICTWLPGWKQKSSLAIAMITYNSWCSKLKLREYCPTHSFCNSSKLNNQFFDSRFHNTSICITEYTYLNRFAIHLEWVVHLFANQIHSRVNGAHSCFWAQVHLSAQIIRYFVFPLFGCLHFGKFLHSSATFPDHTRLFYNPIIWRVPRPSL